MDGGYCSACRIARELVEFVGRQPDLVAIERAVDEARAGLPSVLLVSGDAGIGKSTLVAEAAERFGLLVYLGRCMLLDGGMIPLAPVKDLVRQIHRDTPVPAHDLAAATRQTTDWVQGTARSTPIAAGAVFASVLDLVAGLSTTDAVMVGIEDLHWADTSTWDLFEFLARSLTDERVVLVGTFRDHDATGGALLRRRLGELSRLTNVHRLRLVGLDPAEVATRVEALLGEPPTPSLVEEIIARGQGNPFFTEELVAAHLAGQPIPELLADLLSADIAAVDDDTRAVIEAIAVVGRGTSHELLGDVTGMGEQTLEYAVKVAVDAHLIVVDVDTATYRFRHALIGEVVYAGLLPAARLRLHGQVAEVLQERAGNGDQAQVVSELALHLDRAGDHAGALVASLAAADAAEAFAPAVALRHLERAFELWDVGRYRRRRAAPRRSAVAGRRARQRHRRQ